MKTRYLVSLVLFLLFASVVYSQDNDSIREKHQVRHPQDVKWTQTRTQSTKTKKVSINFLGYVKLLGTFDWGNVQNTSEFITSSIPIYPTAREEKPRFSFDPRQSRVAVEGLYQLTNSNKLRIYIEADFYNEEAMTTYVPHLRQAYAEYGSFVVGYTYSTISNIAACPNQVDFEGASSIIGPTQAQVRYNYLRDKYSFAVAVETHLEDFTPYPDVDEITDFQLYPDLIAYYQRQGKWGNVRVAGILRNISYTDSTNKNVGEVFGWGVNITGYVNLFKRLEINDIFYFGFGYGKGISYYFSDFSGLGYDAMPDKNNLMYSLPVYGGFVAYRHSWSSKMESNIIASFVNLDNANINNDWILDKTIYGAINFMYNPFYRINFGAEFLYGKSINKKQDWGEGFRIQLMSVVHF